MGNSTSFKTLLSASLHSPNTRVTLLLVCPRTHSVSTIARPMFLLGEGRGRLRTSQFFEQKLFPKTQVLFKTSFAVSLRMRNNTRGENSSIFCFSIFFCFQSKNEKTKKIDTLFYWISIFPFLDQNRKIGQLKPVALEFLFFNFFTKMEKVLKNSVLLDSFEFYFL